MNFKLHLILLLLNYYVVYGELTMVIEIFRHGNRYPLWKDIWNSNNYLNYLGELNQLGINMQFNLGLLLK